MGELTNVLFIGDIIGKPGRVAVRELLPKIVGSRGVDFVVANGENAAAGFGITPAVAEELFHAGVDVITSGNHIWDKKEVVRYIADSRRLLRPENYPESVPGGGHGVFETNSGTRIGVMNLSGRVFMDDLECPFKAGRDVAAKLAEEEEADIIVIDFHAEATSEKTAFGWHMDGKVSAVVGTHTHVQTADERVLPGGTAFITDAGMTGSTYSVIGVRKEDALERFLTQMPKKFEVAKKDVELQAVLILIETEGGRALKIERIKLPYGHSPSDVCNTKGS